MPYNIVADSFHTKKLCSRLSSSEVRFYTENGRFAFLSHLGGGGSGATYTMIIFRLIEKRVVDFLLVLIEVFFASCYGWGATNEYRFKIGDFAPTGAGWLKISGRRGRPTSHSSSQKTRIHDLSYGIKIWAIVSFVLSQTERRTDRQNSYR